jgi:hypothetical protein
VTPAAVVAGGGDEVEGFGALPHVAGLAAVDAAGGHLGGLEEVRGQEQLVAVVEPSRGGERAGHLLQQVGALQHVLLAEAALADAVARAAGDAPVAVDAIEAFVLERREDRADVEFPVLAAEHALVPRLPLHVDRWQDFGEGGPSPGRGGRLPRHVHAQQPVEVVFAGVGVPELADVAGASMNSWQRLTT